MVYFKFAHFLNSATFALFITRPLGVVSSDGIDQRSNSGLVLPELPVLPFQNGYDALAPYISADTLHFHHDKHHAKYVSNTLALIDKTELSSASLEQIIRHAHQNKDMPLFNNAAQCYNHAFYWKCMRGEGDAVASVAPSLRNEIEAAFSDMDGFRKQFISKAMGVFGSGWVWLVVTPTGLKITATAGAGTPLTEQDEVPILVVDVWEHAYYLDYKNDRQAYLEAFFDHLINWQFVNEQWREASQNKKKNNEL